MRVKKILSGLFTVTTNRLVVFLLSLMFLLTSFIMCNSIRQERIDADKQVLYKYSNDVNTVLSNSVEKVTTVLKYGYIENRIKSDKDSIEDRYLFSMDIDAFLGAQETEYCAMSIYISDAEVYESKHLQRLEKLENYNEIASRLKEGYFVWEDEITEDSNGNLYISFYKQIGIDNSNVISCQVKIPPCPLSCSIVKDADNNSFTYLSQKLIDGYSVIMERNDNINEYIYVVLSIFSAICVLFVIIRYIMYVQRKRMSEFIFSASDSGVEQIISNENELDIELMNEGEFNDIKKIIGDLIRKISKITEQKFDLELEKKEFEIKMLQRQIDPHTLYNSLSAIKYNALIREDAETIELVENMVLYYRAVLNRGKLLFSLEEEMEMIKNYVKINESSRAICYNLKIELPDELKQVQILHCLFQPFVENAIIHGLVDRKKDLKLEISCYQTDDGIKIEISDNGAGIESKRLEQLGELENYDESYGIKNAYRRMKLYYGDNSDIKINSEYNKGTVIEIILKNI